MPIDSSVQRKVASMSDEMSNIRQKHKDNMSAQSDAVKNQLDMLKRKKDQILDAQAKRNKATNASANTNSSTANVSSHHDTGLSTEQVDVTVAIDAMLSEKLATGGFNYEKEVNDKLKKMGKAHKDSTTAGSSADAPDAKFNHDGKEHHLEVKQNSKAMFGQIELHHDGKKWDISERSKKKYPHTTRAIQDTGFLHKVNKQWDKPTGDYESDLQKGNVYHTHHDAEPIKAHYGKDRKTDYIQIGGGHGFYHTGKDAAKLGSPELEGKATLRARMKARGTDRKTGKRKYGALIVMGLKDADKSHHNLDETTQKKWISDALDGHVIFETVLNPKDPHADYKAKSKALQDLSANKDVDQAHVQQRRLDLDKEYSKYKKESLDEARGSADKHWAIAQDHKEKASLATKGSESYHNHMVNHHESMSRYHEELGQSNHAQAHEEKAESHHEKAMAAVKGIKESDASWAAAKEKEKEDRLTDKDKNTLSKLRNMLAKEKKPVKEDLEEGTFKYHMDKAIAAHDRGDVNRKKFHLDNAKQARYSLKSTDIAKHKDLLDKYKQLSEAHKIGDKVIIHKGPKDVVGKTGHVGEIRKRWAGDTKTYTIDHDGGSIQLKSSHFKALKEDMDQLRSMLNKHSELAIAANRKGDDEKVKHHQNMMNKVKDKMAKMVKEDATDWGSILNEDTKGFVDAFWSGQQEEPKKNPYTEGTTEYYQYENGYMQGVMKRRAMQTESHAPVAPVPDRKYIKGTPEYKAHKATKKPINGHPTNVQEEGEGAVAANNAGDGKIAGFQGDAGKKVKMMSEPLRRKAMPKFKTYVSQEHDQA